MGAKREKKIVIVNPNNGGNYVQTSFSREHLGLAQLTAELNEADHDAIPLDFRLDPKRPKEAAEEILQYKPCLIGISIITKTAAGWSQEVAAIIKSKKPDTLLVAGNYFPSLQPKRALNCMPDIDCVVIGEGDESIVELANCIVNNEDWRKIKGLTYRIKNGVRNTGRRPLIIDLEALPFPQHYGMKYGLKELPIEGSRGCFYNCCFCSIQPFFCAEKYTEKWRARSPENIAKEIRENQKKYPEIKIYRFVDSNAIGTAKPEHVKRMERFVDRLGPLGIQFIIATRPDTVSKIPTKLWKALKGAGLIEAYIGIETTSPYIKKMMCKGTTVNQDREAVARLREANIKVRFGYMMITPWTKEQDIKPEAKALVELGFPRLDKFFQELFVVPGTRLVELTKKIADIRWDYDGEGEYYTYSLPKPIDNLRRAGRWLTNNCLMFLEQHQELHETIRLRDEYSYKNVTKYINALNKLSLTFFLSIFDTVKKLDGSVSDERIGVLIEKVVKQYQKKLNQLKLDFAKEIKDYKHKKP